MSIVNSGFRHAYLMVTGMRASSSETAKLFSRRPDVVRDIGDRPMSRSKGSKVAYIGFRIANDVEGRFRSVSHALSCLRSDVGLVAALSESPVDSTRTLVLHGHTETPAQTISTDDLIFLSEHALGISFELSPP